MVLFAVVESNRKLNFSNNKISDPNTSGVRQPKQNNYIYQPYYGYQSYYVVHRPSTPSRPTKQPTRRTTTQRYSIWDLSRKRRDVESSSEKAVEKYSNDVRKKRQIDIYGDSNYDGTFYNLPLLFGRRRNYAVARNQPYSMWDLTRK